MAESQTIELQSPIEIDGATVKTLSMREPTVEDQITSSEVKGSEAVQEVTMIANLCEVAPADIRRVTLRDYRQLQETFLGFIN